MNDYLVYFPCLKETLSGAERIEDEPSARTAAENAVRIFINDNSEYAPIFLKGGEVAVVLVGEGAKEERFMVYLEYEPTCWATPIE